MINLNRYFKIVFIWCPLVTILFVIGFGGFTDLSTKFIVSLIISETVATFSYVGSKLFRKIINLFRFKYRLPPKTGLFWGVLTSYPFLVPGLYFGFLLSEVFCSKFLIKWSPPKITDYSSGIIFGIMVSLMFTLFEVLRDAREAKNKAEIKFNRLENDKLKAQISALTAQMNPHLLFNALNTIASTIGSYPNSAEEMVVQLSDLYRGILKSTKGEVHSLENELDLCRSYLEIEKKRFGSRIDYSIQVDGQLDSRLINIPVLILQPLVENAVKHGLAPKKDGGLITVVAEKQGEALVVHVTDTGVGLSYQKLSTGTGTGLENCESRIKLKYGDRSKFILDGSQKNLTTASIYVPLIEVRND